MLGVKSLHDAVMRRLMMVLAFSSNKKLLKMHVKSTFGRLSITSITPSITLETPMNKGKVIDVIDVIDVFQLF